MYYSSHTLYITPLVFDTYINIFAKVTRKEKKMTELGDGNYYGADMHVGNFGEAGSEVKLHDSNGTYVTNFGLGAVFKDAMSDNVKIVYQYSNGLYIVFLKKSDGSFRFGFFENAVYTTDEAAAANYTEAEVDSKMDGLAASWQGNFDLSHVWPAEGGASGDPFITPVF